jgi:iron complex transport system substrate-binding protein
MKNTPTSTAFAAIVCLAVLLGGCGQKQMSDRQNNIVWIKNAYATLFRVGHNGTDSFLELYADAKSKKIIGAFHWGQSKTIKGYEKLSNRNRIVSLSSIHTCMLASLNAHGALVGIESQHYVSHPKLYNHPQLKSLPEVAPNGPIILEKLAFCNPTLLFGTLSSVEDKQAIERLGKGKFSVLWCNNHLENHPLGRSEWIIALGWVVGKSAIAQQQFNHIKKDYEALASEVQHSDHPTPKVITNCAYNGVWFVPQHASYMGQFIRDAGGEPITVETGTGSNAVSIEKAIGLFVGADIWINTDLCNSLSCLASSDPRVTHIKAFQRGQVFHFNKQLRENGSNPYWDMGCLYPNHILRDLKHIFAGDFQLDSFYYYDICK